MRLRSLALTIAALACGLPLAADAAKPAKASLTIAARPQAVTYGGVVVISGQRRDGAWVTVPRTLTQQATGNLSRYSKRVRIRRSGIYRVKVRGHADHSSGISRVRVIRVR